MGLLYTRGRCHSGQHHREDGMQTKRTEVVAFRSLSASLGKACEIAATPSLRPEIVDISHERVR
jgi:hypothetical protein